MGQCDREQDAGSLQQKARPLEKTDPRSTDKDPLPTRIKRAIKLVVLLIIWRNFLQAIWRKRLRLPALADPEKLGPTPVGKSASHQGRVIYGGIGKDSRIPAESCYGSSR
jgi:hypothetical protein